MQPYFFPYIGYFQLINAVDKFVVYDDVSFIKNGWINRNKIIMNNEVKWLTLQVQNASSNKYIYEVDVGSNHNKILKSIFYNYSKAINFKECFSLIEKVMKLDINNLSLFLIEQLKLICRRLDIKTEILVSSDLSLHKNLKGEDRVIAICKSLGAEVYINSIGGINLYDKYHFQKENIELRFINSRCKVYPQSTLDFKPNLSIVDVMMNNSYADVITMLDDYDLMGVT